jgi:Ca2+-binding EF-hand superfamily protein
MNRTGEIAEEIIRDFPKELGNKVRAEIAESMVKEIYKKK